MHDSRLAPCSSRWPFYTFNPLGEETLPLAKLHGILRLKRVPRPNLSRLHQRRLSAQPALVLGSSLLSRGAEFGFWLITPEVFCRENDREMLSECFGFAPSQDAFGLYVPTGDLALRVERKKLSGP